MTIKEMSTTFCEYTFTAEHVKLYIVSGYNSLHCPSRQTTDNDIFHSHQQSDPVPWLQLFSFEKYAVLPFDQECRTLASFFLQAMNNKQGLLAGSYLFAFLTRLAYLQLPDRKDSADSDSDVGRIYKIDQIMQRYYKNHYPCLILRKNYICRNASFPASLRSITAAVTGNRLCICACRKLLCCWPKEPALTIQHTVWVMNQCVHFKTLL